jgi:hypothetical protein
MCQGVEDVTRSRLPSGYMAVRGARLGRGGTGGAAVSLRERLLLSQTCTRLSMVMCMPSGLPELPLTETSVSVQLGLYIVVESRTKRRRDIELPSSAQESELHATEAPGCQLKTHIRYH